MLPNAITIGAKKCGTTALHHYFAQHPEIGVSRFKELAYFVDEACPLSNRHRGPRWYARQFPDDAPVRCESSPEYTSHPEQTEVPRRMHELVPDARLIYLVRDPVERAVSHWVHDYSNSEQHRRLEDALDRTENNPYLDRSRYYTQLSRFLEFYDASRILVISQEELLHRRRETLRRTFRFLGVRDDFWTPAFEAIHHRSSEKRRNNALGLALHRRLGTRIFWRLHGEQRYRFKKLVYGPLSRPIERPTLRPELRRRLEEAFRPEVERLERFAGRSFGWGTGSRSLQAGRPLAPSRRP